MKRRGSEDWALRDPLRDWGEGECVTREGDELLPVGEVGGEPVECSALNTLLAQPGSAIVVCFLQSEGAFGPGNGCFVTCGVRLNKRIPCL